MTPSDQTRDPIVYVNGAFVLESQAKISVFDHVILYGDGVYDTMCAWNHQVFKLDEHIDRLYESAHAINLELSLGKEELRAVILETVRRNNLRNAYVKVAATRGVGAQPLMSPYNCTPGLIVFAVPYMSLVDGEGEESGIRMIVSSLRRIPNECLSTKIKSCNYLNHILMRMEANEAGADDAIELDTEWKVSMILRQQVAEFREQRSVVIMLVQRLLHCSQVNNVMTVAWSIDPNFVWHLWRRGPTAHKPLWMRYKGRIQYPLLLLIHLVHLAVMDHRRRHQSQSVVMMFVIVPLEKVACPAASKLSPLNSPKGRKVG